MSNKTRLDDPAQQRRTRLDGVGTAAGATRLDRPGPPPVTESGERQPWSSHVPPLSPADDELVRLPSKVAAGYELVELLPATGAEADLAIVRQRDGGEMAVAKLYRRGIRPKAAVLERVRTLDSPHVVKLLSHGEADGVYYELMEYCPHGSLRELMQRGLLTPTQRRALVAQIAGALALAHRAGIIHRDLKPENLLLRHIEPLDLALADFGIASVQESTQRFTGLARTVYYAAPETLSGVLDAKADYWSLGIILLEAAVGRHPFSDLSEAVAIHRLATGSMDVAAIADPAWRNLARGLLLRNPKKRWGAQEIARWLAGDPDLQAPEEHAPAARAHPYHLENLACTSAEQLGVALARYWDEGKKDMVRGLIREWLKEELADQNLVRFHDDLMALNGISDDIRLSRLVIRLAPQLPPVWRGGRVTPEALLVRAAKAAQWDETAGEWLHSLFESRVLEAYGASGNDEVRRIDREWRDAWTQFCSAWQQAQKKVCAWREQGGRDPDYVSDAPVDVDALIYGGLAFPARPRMLRVLGPLLLAQLDATAFRALAAEAQAEMLVLLPDCPWLGLFGNFATLEPGKLLVLCFLLPEAQSEGMQQRKQRERAQNFNASIVNELVQEIEACLRDVRSIVLRGRLSANERQRLTLAIDEFASISARIRRTRFTDAGLTPLLDAIEHGETVLHEIRVGQDELERIITINRGWRSIPVLSFVAGATFMAYRYELFSWAAGILACACLVSTWRYLVSWRARRHLKLLASYVRTFVRKDMLPG